MGRSTAGTTALSSGSKLSVALVRPDMTFHRRHFFRQGLAAAATLGTAAWWRGLFAGTQTAGAGPYGPLGPPDAMGVCVPAGFSVRLLATTGQRVTGTDHVWHGAPDGGAVFRRASGGWIYVSNSELDGGRGGAGVLAFDARGEIDDAWRILVGTTWNCAGGATPWGTWLSCEEIDEGLVWECDPYRPGQGTARPALGRFKHEAAAVDPTNGDVYLTEDDYDGRFYRFRPRRRGDLTQGVLTAAVVAPGGQVSWVPVSDRMRARSPETSPFQRGEGIFYADGTVYFSTTADHRVWAYDTRRATLDLVYDAVATAGILRNPDNLTVHARSGDLYVAEDGDDLQIVLFAAAAGTRIIAPFVQLVGHDESEVTGVAFSPDGRRLYFSSQRGRDGATGMSFEVSGPFRGGA